MNSFIRIRASSKPADFFDEVIPDEGYELNGWRFTRHQIPDFIPTPEGPDVEVISRWLYAETESEPGEWEATLHDKRNALDQALNVFAAIRQARISEALEFTMWFEDYVHDGRTGSIQPFRIDVCVGIQNFQTIDANGNVIFDARIAQEKHDREEMLKARRAAKAEVQSLAKYVKFLGNPAFRRAWESYRLARGRDPHAMSHMYDVREVANKAVGGAQKKLGLSCNEWSRFGLILNNQAVEGGRHNGRHTDPMRPLTTEERSFLLNFGERLLFAFGDYLLAEEQAAQKPAENDPADSSKH
ncbi:hypothetical protein [Pseudomonas syringae]|uniref:hypothetical protein n=1 Tax=Pseudomonas syringae TaxID=317 RepID=UPI000E316EE4|nr:hypothetical protein [Pseudomonas syringae]